MLLAIAGISTSDVYEHIFIFSFTFENNNKKIAMGNYVENNLIKGESVAFETTYHWIIFLHWRSLLTLFIQPALARWSDEFAITNHRIIVKTGLISRRTLEMNLNKVETVNVDQSILGRMLGYGTIRIVGTGGTNEIFENIAQPIEFRKKFLELSL